MTSDEGQHAFGLALLSQRLHDYAPNFTWLAVFIGVAIGLRCRPSVFLYFAMLLCFITGVVSMFWVLCVDVMPKAPYLAIASVTVVFLTSVWIQVLKATVVTQFVFFLYRIARRLLIQRKVQKTV